MNFLVCTAFVFGIAYWLYKPIRKYSPLLYTLAAVAAFAFGWFSLLSAPAWFKAHVIYAFQRGSLSAAFFTVVMFTALFKNGTGIKKRLMSIRAELSIIGCFLALGHNLATGKTYFKALFLTPEKLSPSQLAASVISLALIAIMLPLMVTSFRAVRQKMKPLAWKKLQRWAYPFYMLIYVHVVVLTLPLYLAGRGKYLPNLMVYTLVFMGYAIGRLIKAKSDSKRRKPV